MSRIKIQNLDESTLTEQRTTLEYAFQAVLHGLSSPGRRATKEYGQALGRAYSAMFAMAYNWSYGEPNETCRRELARCAVQECHVKLLGVGFNSYRKRSRGRPLTPLVINILRNICKTSYKMNSQTRNRHQSYHVSGDDFCDPRQNPFKAAAIRELQHDCREAMKSLSPTLRECVYLTYWEDLPAKVVAVCMGTTPGTIDSRNFCARKQLGRVLEKRGHWPL